jgi:glyoxylase-like metal-dependent hydrolase (beta-lactamase superfamily II)
MQVTSRVYQLSGPLGTGVMGANVYLLVGDGLTLVDTGFWGRARRVLRGVERLGYSPADIRRIIITHHHADHAGSLATLKALTGAEVVAHRADAPYLDGSLPQPGPCWPRWLGGMVAPLHRFWATAPAMVETLVDEGSELPGAGGMKVLHTPGHTPGSISLLLQQEGVVIVGDVLVHRFGLKLPTRFFTVDLPQEIRSVRRVADLDFEIVCFGHGKPLRKDARAAVVRFAERLEREHRRVRCQEGSEGVACAPGPARGPQTSTPSSLRASISSAERPSSLP